MTFSEFPKMLCRGTGEHVIVDNLAQEQQFLARGYAAPGKSDPEAVERAFAMQGRDHEVVEYPKFLGDNVVANNREEEEAFLRRQAAMTTTALSALVGGQSR